MRYTRPGGIAPGFLQFLPHGGGEVLKPPGVLAAVYVAGGQPQLLFRKRIPVVAAPLDNAVNQLIAVGRNVFHPVTGGLESVEQIYDRRRGVQPHRVADAGVLGGVVAH